MNRQSPSVSLLKTCQTCFRAKIRCEKSQDSDQCDRCLRLGKTCVFNAARRPRRRLSPPKASGRSASKSSRTSTSRSWSRSPGTALTAELSSSDNRDATLDPFQKGLLSAEDGQILIDHFGDKMLPHFPFVVLPKHLPVSDLNRERPCACLAVLAAASYAEAQLQQMLGTHFTRLVAARLTEGNFNDVDLLQGLLVHLAWVHYQPRPKIYTQYLYLAISIVSDLRLDKPRRPKLWAVDGGKDRNEPDWGPDEKRALAGAYYLSSCSSIVLQKSRHFSFSRYISTCCSQLALLDHHPTDRYLAHIIHAQSLIEKMDDLVSQASLNEDPSLFAVRSQEIAQECAEIKTSLPFPLSESPPLLLQVHLLKLLLSQSSPHGTSFGLDRFQNRQTLSESEPSLIDRLSASIYAVRSLISVALYLPQGEEAVMANLGWVVMYCSLSMAVRLDLIVAKGSIPGQTQHLRRCLDMPHTLRQTVLRLEAAAGSQMSFCDDQTPFKRLAGRVLKLEEWYLDHASRASHYTIAESQLDRPDVTILDLGEGENMFTDPITGQTSWQGGPDWYQDPGSGFSGVFSGLNFDFAGSSGI